MWPLRRDKGLMAGLSSGYYMMKPSTEMNAREIQKFSEHGPSGLTMFDPTTRQNIVEAVSRLDAVVARPHVEPTVDDFIQKAIVMATTFSDKTAGAAFSGLHLDYVQHLHTLFGDPLQHWETQGPIILGHVAWTMYEIILGLEEHQFERLVDYAVERYADGQRWVVLGKKDGYKVTKLDIGRTIQAPIVELKVIWAAIFQSSDDRWIGRMKEGSCTWVYAGASLDNPVSDERIAMYRKARRVVALDATAFDRRIPEWMLKAFFYYMGYNNPGVPLEVLTYLFEVTCYSILVLSDGRCYMKTQGNPSGFMNTIRLNNFVSMLSWTLVILYRHQQLGGVVPRTGPEIQSFVMGHFHIECCGDDTRVWALTEYGAKLLGANGEEALTVWRTHLPWAMKLEGAHDMCGSFLRDMLAVPPMVARQFVPWPVGGSWYLWEPMINTSRYLRTLMHDGGRSPAQEEEVLMGVAASAAHTWYEWKAGRLVDAAIQCFDKHWVQPNPWVAEHMYSLLATRFSDNVPRVHPLPREEVLMYLEDWY